MLHLYHLITTLWHQYYYYPHSTDGELGLTKPKNLLKAAELVSDNEDWNLGKKTLECVLSATIRDAPSTLVK